MSPAMPAAASRCPKLVFTDPIRRGELAARSLHNAYLLAEMKREYLTTPDLPPDLAATVRALTRIVDFDAQVTAPLNGFSSAEDYQRQSSALPLIGRIRTPTLAIHADDDPWIPAADYRRADWAGGAARLLMARGGGHLGFHGAAGTWHDDCLVAFLEAGGREAA